MPKFDVVIHAKNRFTYRVAAATPEKAIKLVRMAEPFLPPNVVLTATPIL